MRSVFIFTVILGVAKSLPLGQNTDADITVVRSHQENNDDGSFNWAYQNSDGTQQEQSGYVKNPGTEQAGIYIQGSYSYPDKDVGTVSLKYTADENGFLPEGAHLPVSPPIPEHVQKLLATVYGNARKQVREAQTEYF